MEVVVKFPELLYGGDFVEGGEAIGIDLFWCLMNHKSLIAILPHFFQVRVWKIHVPFHFVGKECEKGRI